MVIATRKKPNIISVGKLHYYVPDMREPENGTLEITLSPITPEQVELFKVWLLENGPAPKINRDELNTDEWEEIEPEPEEQNPGSQHASLVEKLVKEVHHFAKSNYNEKLYLIHHPRKNPIFSLSTDPLTRAGRCVLSFYPQQNVHGPLKWITELKTAVAETIAGTRPIGDNVFPDGTPVPDITLPSGEYRVNGYWYKPSNSAYQDIGDSFVTLWDQQIHLDRMAETMVHVEEKEQPHFSLVEANKTSQRYIPYEAGRRIQAILLARKIFHHLIPLSQYGKDQQTEHSPGVYIVVPKNTERKDRASVRFYLLGKNDHLDSDLTKIGYVQLSDILPDTKQVSHITELVCKIIQKYLSKYA